MLISAFLTTSLTGQKMYANDPRVIGTVAIGIVIASGGVYELLKEKSRPFKGLVLLGLGTTIAVNSNAICRGEISKNLLTGGSNIIDRISIRCGGQPLGIGAYAAEGWSEFSGGVRQGFNQALTAIKRKLS